MKTASTNNLVNGWEVVIGLEVHAQISSQSKLFSGSSTSFGSDPNTQVAFFDAAIPGTLPVVNSFCIDQAIKTGYGINGTIHKISIFDRKNYFYPDLPSGYQISQFFKPIVTDGEIIIDLLNGSQKIIRIERIHIEQDAGKSIHDLSPNKSFIDLNRAGIPLMEIVSKPDISSPHEAIGYLKKLRTILRYIGSCDGDMSKGNMRADANISVRRPGDPFGKRAEIKNLNSTRAMGQALDYEIRRQIEKIESGEEIIQETRLFDSVTGTTRSMRTKEDSSDYRYFHDPDLKPVIVSDDRLQRLKTEIPELPDQKKDRFVKEYGINKTDAAILTEDFRVANLYEEAVKASSFPKTTSAKLISNWIIVELFSLLNKNSMDICDIGFPITYIADIVDLILNEIISGKIAKAVFSEMFEKKKSPREIVSESGLEQITDEPSIEAAAKAVIEKNADKVLEYKSGKDKLFGFFVGQTMASFSGKANPAIVNSILKKVLS